MKLVFSSVVAFALGVSFTLPCTQAQTPPPAPAQTMDLASAKRIVAAAEAAAVALNQHVAICVLDSNGDVVLWERMDGTNHQPVVTSAGKARAALLFGRPTRELAESIAASKPVEARLTPLPSGITELTLQQGGLPIFKAGKLIGAIGIGGSASTNDEKFAQAGIDALLANQKN